MKTDHTCWLAVKAKVNEPWEGCKRVKPLGKLTAGRHSTFILHKGLQSKTYCSTTATPKPMHPMALSAAEIPVLTQHLPAQTHAPLLYFEALHTLLSTTFKPKGMAPWDPHPSTASGVGSVHRCQHNPYLMIEKQYWQAWKHSGLCSPRGEKNAFVNLKVPSIRASRLAKISETLFLMQCILCSLLWLLLEQ